MSVIVDGHTYEDESLAPDLGTLECVGTNGNIRKYEGFIVDLRKLPKYDDLATGSSCLFTDEGSVFKYNAKAKKWRELGGTREV